VLEGMPGWEVVGETGNGNDAIAMATRLRPDLILLDMSLPGAHGLDVLRAVKQASLATKVVVLTGYASPYLMKAARAAGAEAFVPKDLSWKEFVHVLELVLAGKKYVQESVAEQAASGPWMVEQLTRRERQVLELLSGGMSNRAIGEALGVLQSTVDSHVKSIIGKLGASNRMQAAEVARQSGLIR